jgi:putative aldouronate transport system permease protein
MIRKGLVKKIWAARLLYLIFLPGFLYFIVFKYLPMFGIVIAFQDYSVFKGVLNSPWVGLKHFESFLGSAYFYQVLKNTFLLAFFTLAVGFPLPIIFALLLNEARNVLAKRFVQSLSLFPYFVSSAVAVSLVYSLLNPQGGLINELIGLFGIKPISFLAEPGWFRSIYVSLNVWQGLGYGTIIYLAAITAIDPQLYEAAEMDGANRWHKILHITLPSISNTMIIVLILNIGGLLSTDLDKILLLYNPAVYETADVIQSYVYRRGLGIGGALPQYSLAAAVGIFQSVVALALVFLANLFAKKFTDTRLY